MTEGLPASLETFSLVRGGAFLRLMLSLRLARPSLDLGLRTGVLLALLLWLPLLLLALAQGVAIGSTVEVPFIRDLPAGARFLLAVPIMIVAEMPIRRRINETLIHIARSGIVTAEQMPRFAGDVARAQRALGSGYAEIAGLIAVVFVVVFLRIEPSAEVSNWRFLPGSGGLQRSAAGWAYLVFSLPVAQFVLYRWLWRYAVWCWVLWRLSRLKLRLVPIHPDGTAGLAIVGIAQVGFGLIVAATSIVLGAEYAQEILFKVQTLTQAAPALLGYTLVILAIVLGPLLLFSPALMRTRWQGLRDYAELGDRYVESFSRKWIRGNNPDGDKLLGTADIQSLADLAGSHEIVRSMRIVPCDLRTVFIPLLACTVIPLLPAALAEVPVDQIVRELLSRLL